MYEMKNILDYVVKFALIASLTSLVLAEESREMTSLPLQESARVYLRDEQKAKSLAIENKRRKAKGLPVAFVGDVVGTGSSRKSAANSVLWYFGDDIPGVPNKRSGGVCIGGKILSCRSSGPMGS